MTNAASNLHRRRVELTIQPAVQLLRKPSNHAACSMVAKFNLMDIQRNEPAMSDPR